MPMSDPDAKFRLTDWFLKWRQPLRKFLIGKGTVPASDLDDIAQEVFLRLMRYGRTELIEHPQAYLYKMASNVAAEYAIRGRYQRSREPEWLAGLSGEDPVEPVEDQAQEIELQDEIERALLTLTPQQRQVLRLQFYSGLNRAEIASQTGLTERSVKRALMKSYEKLRHQLNPESFASVSHARVSHGRE
jgi:RNA polymerase sigma factor (sigma-70 family)